jgi:hypothetical protein
MAIPSKDQLIKFIEDNPDSFSRLLKSHHKNLCAIIDNKYQYTKFAQKLYHYIYGDDVGKCPMCGGFGKFTSIRKGYRKYCSYVCSGRAKIYASREIRNCKICNSEFEAYKKADKHFCSDACRKVQNKLNAKERVKKSVESSIRNHGGVHHMSLQEHRIKSNLTRLTKYGDENFNNTNKCKQTKLEKYGNETYNNMTQNKATKLEKYGDETYNNREKFLNTMNTEYGGCTFNSPELRKKYDDTLNRKYGVSYPMQNSELLKQAIETKNEKYGCGNNVEKLKATWKQMPPEKIMERTDKIRNTCLEKYGVHNILLLHKSNGIGISKVQREYFDKVKEIYSDAQLEYYISELNIQVDIYIPSQNKIIEVYGDYWHCNPNIFTENTYHTQLHMTAGDKWEFDLKRKTKLESAGYIVDIIWESEINN